MVSCLSCQSSTSAKLSVAPLDQYQLVCQSLGQTEFPKVYVPGQTSTTTTAAPSTNTPLATSGSNSGNNGAGHSNLSSGAVAGIVVSAIALIVALSVAGYVFAKRRRELAKQREEEELYKYQDATRSSYMESPLPQYTGIQSSLPSLPQLTNLRVMNPDNDDDDERGNAGRPRNQNGQSFDVTRTSPGWRRGSFDDD
ncbi:hypothetical protein BGZ54_003692 [Gamsiella multidivaricata]|nr:hypothetical protein BGZ54_003692 [Gamsiella multidivaricata]